jgi:AsmA protein
VSVIDESSDTRLEFSDVELRGSWERRRAAIQEMKGRLNGGQFELAAQLDRVGASPSFEGHLRATGVDLGVGMRPLGYLVPVLAGPQAKVDGKLDLNLYVRGQGNSAELVRKTLVGQGSVAIDPIQFDGSRIVAELASLVALPPQGRVGSVRSQFAIGDGRISSDNLTLSIAEVPITMAGWTDFDGRIDYRIRQEGLSSKLSREARDLLGDLPIDLDDLVNLQVQGTLDALVVTMDGVPLGGGPHPDIGRQADRKRLRELGRRLRDRVLK